MPGAAPAGGTDSRPLCAVPGVLEPGDHTVVCGNCGDSYPVNTIVSYSFTSPALSPAAPPPEEET
jgi:hypothetical protein